jgi:hypothetical protein
MIQQPIVQYVSNTRGGVSGAYGGPTYQRPGAIYTAGSGIGMPPGSGAYKYSSTDTYIYPYIYIFRLDRLLTRSINHLLVVVPTLSISVRHELSSSILTYISILVRHELSSYLLTHIYRYIVPSRKSHVTGSPGSPPSSVCFELVAIVKLTS